VLQCVATSTSSPSSSSGHTKLMVQHTSNKTAPHCNVLQHNATHRRHHRRLRAWPTQNGRCVALQHTATHYNTLQHTTTHCNTLQHTATHYNTLQHTAVHKMEGVLHCNTLQHTTTHCNTLQHTATRYNTLQHTTTHCNILQYTKWKVQHRAVYYRVAKTHRIPYLYRSFLAKEPYIQWLFCGK